MHDGGNTSIDIWSREAETLATTKGHEKKLDVNEMRMLRWMCKGTKKRAK